MSIEKVSKEKLLKEMKGKLSDDALETVVGGISDWALKCIKDADELYRSGAIDHAEWYSRQMSCRSIG